MDGKDVRIIRNLSWTQAATMGTGNHVGESTEIKKRIRNSLLVLQSFRTAQKSGNIILTY